VNQNQRHRPIRPLGKYDGVLVVDKPPGPTSHDIVASIKRHFKFDKVGHGGTLDPQATGVLVILIERGTKLSNRFIGSDKTYEGVMHLGVATDTQDAQGEVVSEGDWSHVTREDIESQFSQFCGDMMQTPPMVSAAKKNGVPLYKLARKGKTVERDPKLIHIFEFVLVDFAPPRVSFHVSCTKGTYVRTLCTDIGENLGCGAHLAELRRTRSGDLKVEDALTMDVLGKLKKDELLDHIIPLHKFPL
jgi:tRNA pseudouridine55 synthase